MHKHQVDNIGFGMSLQEHSERALKESLHHKQIDSRASPSAFSTAEDASDSAMFSMSAVSMRSGSGYDTRQVNAPSGFFAPTNTRVNSFKQVDFVSNQRDRQFVRSRVTRDPALNSTIAKSTMTAQPYGRRDPTAAVVQHDMVLKVVLIGASNSGKTSLLLRFVEQVFEEGLQNTIGVDFKMKTLMIDDKVAKVQVWDTAG